MSGKNEKAMDKIVLVSPSGHEYEVTVSDAGILTVKLKGK
jgi:hypothetical protein